MGTLHMKLYLMASLLIIINWCVDAAYGVHWDCKDHTGTLMSMEKGAVLSFSRGQKLNAGSSTEAEIVAVDEGITKPL